MSDCIFKQVCRTCNKVDVIDRPSVCEAMECPDYIPCPKCGQNRTLHQLQDGSKVCKKCAETSKVGIKSQIKVAAEMQSSGIVAISSPDATKVIKATITPPGTPPPELSEAEKEYYNRRWEDYKGYYRNPSAYHVCHMLILIEIHINYLNTKLINSRGELQAETSRDIQVALNMKKLLNDQLPEKEAEDVMDDEKAIAMIYENYIKEKKLRTLGVVSRVFRKDTLALAPKMTFEINPNELLERCGFSVVEIERVLPKIKEFASEKTPEEILEFFGFHLDEKYAMDYEVAQIEDFDPNDELGE